MIIQLPNSDLQLQLLKTQLQKYKSNFIFVDQPLNNYNSKHIAYQTNINNIKSLDDLSQIVFKTLADGIIYYCKGNHLIPWNIYTPTAMYNNSYLTVIDDYILGKVTIVKSV